MEPVMRDDLGRVIDYLRISVTDKCNLRCQYCMPQEGVRRLSHEAVLTLEEIARVCRVMASLGIRKVRVTGGEPLVRKNIVKLIADIRDLPGIGEIAMTTNGVCLAPVAEELRRAGLDRVNISLDTLRPERYARITGRDALKEVLCGLEAALSSGMAVRVNCVPCREFNEEDLEEVAGLSESRPVDVRFIELMPIGCGARFQGIPSGEILGRLTARFGEPKELPSGRGDGPAQYYRFPGLLGRIGVISPISHKFCDRCNRVRLTAEGRLKLCLQYDYGMDLRELLREPDVSDERIRQRIAEAVRQKPGEHHFEGPGEDADGRKMYQIGG